jgi:putative ABC transport system permease protein
VAQVALSLVLLTGAGLLVRSLLNLQAVPPGFRPDHLLTFQISLSPQAYPEVPEQVAFYREVVDRVRSLPGVTAAAAVGDLPLVEDMYVPHNVAFEGRPVPAEEEPDIASRPVTPGYFEAIGVPLRRGRGFGEADGPDAEPVVVVNEALAGQYFPGEDPIGRRLRWSRADEVRWMRIVGVVGDVKHFALDEEEEPAIYWPHAQAVVAWRRMMTVVARASGEPLRLARAVEREVWAVDPDVPVTTVRTMEGWVADSTRRARVQALLLAVFAGAALGLAGLGVYGVLAQGVAQRTAEIGVRMALGARAREVVRLVLRDALALLSIGATLGIAGALVATRLLSGLLFGVAPADPLTYAVILLVIVGAGLLASGLPALRAARLQPSVALRTE